MYMYTLSEDTILKFMLQYLSTKLHQTNLFSWQWEAWINSFNRVTHNHTYWSFSLEWSSRMHKLQIIYKNYITSLVRNSNLELLIYFIDLNELFCSQLLTISPSSMKRSLTQWQLGVWVDSIEILSMTLNYRVHVKHESIMLIWNMKSRVPILQMQEVIFTPSNFVILFL